MAVVKQVTTKTHVTMAGYQKKWRSPTKSGHLLHFNTAEHKKYKCANMQKCAEKE